MRTFKNSGVEWIGDIPQDWEIKRIKNGIDFNKFRNVENTKEEILSVEKGIVRNQNTLGLNDTFYNYLCLFLLYFPYFQYHY